MGAIENSMNDPMMYDSMVEALSRFLDVNVARHKLIASNLANIDTPGYQTKDLDFQSAMQVGDPALAALDEFYVVYVRIADESVALEVHVGKCDPGNSGVGSLKLLILA